MEIPRAVAVVLDGPKVLVIKRYRRHAAAAECRICRDTGTQGPECPGHHYAVLPGGHVEEGETAEAAALRELHEETTLRARIDRLLWTGVHRGRAATYFLMADVAGTPALSGPEAAREGPGNHYEPRWVSADEFDRLDLRPDEVRAPLARLLRGE